MSAGVCHPPERRLKLVLFGLAQRAGLFRLARHLTRRRLRILCYHGFALRDEHRFKPRLFMQAKTFEGRMRWLRENGYPVLGLAQALERLRADAQPDCAVVITIDDGWRGVLDHAAPVLERHGLPATLYLTTYYAEQQRPVFNVLMQYLFWKTTAPAVDLAKVDPDLDGRYELATAAGRAAACTRLIEHGERQRDAVGRTALAEAAARALGVDGKDLFRLIGREDLPRLQAAGMDIQLHTHRHRLPADSPEALAEEIERNRAVLRAWGAEALEHLCYPSGEYEPVQIPWLRALGIRSATTTRPGLARPDDDPLELPRFVDGEDVTELEFAAELCGFAELLRTAWRRWKTPR